MVHTYHNKKEISPTFNHLILSIPTPSRTFLKRLQNMIYDFIWKNKKDKISRDQLSNDYADDGLRLFKIDLFFEALKCTWIRRIVSGNVDEKGFLLFNKITGLPITDLEKGFKFHFKCFKKYRQSVLEGGTGSLA